MRREWLLLLYPRAWRARYGDELLAALGRDRLPVSQVIDIVRGAIDAWWSPEVRRATAARPLLACDRGHAAGITPRDGLIGAAVMVGGSFMLAILSVTATRAGWPALGRVGTDLGFLGPFTLSMPFWLMPGTSRRAQTTIVGITLALLIASSVISNVR
jgi:hypothetical protein